MEKQGTYEAFVIFIKENQDKFYRLAYSYVKNSDTALDLVQDAIEQALKNLKSLKEPKFIKTWFYRIMVNTCLMYLRKDKKIISIELDENLALNVSCFDKIYNDEILDAINNLDPYLKTIIFLRFFEEMKLEEISKVTKTNLSTVKSRLYKALDLLRVQLHDYNEEGDTCNG